MKDREKWMDLCEQAAKEQDPAKFTALITEIDRLLAEKEKRIRPATQPSKDFER
jgi:hypothetical protein